MRIYITYAMRVHWFIFGIIPIKGKKMQWKGHCRKLIKHVVPKLTILQGTLFNKCMIRSQKNKHVCIFEPLQIRQRNWH